MNATPRRAWLILWGMQVLAALAVFSSFLSGKVYFAYLDIGSDSYGQVGPALMYMARIIASGRWSDWAFEIGLGSPTALMGSDLFMVLNALGGVDNVLPWRIWVYLLKIALGGTAFFMLVRYVVTRWEAAVISALAYSFCGYVVINGQWDGEATAFVFFPLVLWAAFRAMVQGKFTAFPVAVGVALMSGVFFVGMGVKYIIAREPVQWPGFAAVSQSPGQMIYLNQLALPLGIVQTRQVTQATLSRLSLLAAAEADSLRDLALVNAVVVPDLTAGQNEVLTYEDVLRLKTAPLDDSYLKPARDLQTTGLQIQTFSNDHISGTVSPRKAGMLVFSIPFNQGWSLTVDGQATPLVRANFGMLAAPVQAGTHKVVLDFKLPGRRAGIWTGALGLALLALVVVLTRRREVSAQAPGPEFQGFKVSSS